MNEQDLLKMLIEAYEQGLSDGTQKATVENSRVAGWHAIKQRCLKTMRELTEL